MGMEVTTLLTMLHESGEVSRSHGISRDVLAAQARSLGKELVFGAASWDGYEEAFISKLSALQGEGLTGAVFGDIDLQPHRDWEEQACAKAGMNALLPLWAEGRLGLVDEFLRTGFKAIVVSVRGEEMRRWLGREFDQAFIAEAERIGWDACGENGEFHTIVVDGPLFEFPVPYALAEVRQAHDHWMVPVVAVE